MYNVISYHDQLYYIYLIMLLYTTYN